MKNLFGTETPKDLEPFEKQLRLEYMSELVTKLSHGACMSCTKARLHAKYTNKYHRLLASKSRGQHPGA